LLIKKRTRFGELYPNAEFWPERVQMMQVWADYLDDLRKGGKIVPLRL
jgi:hypothetical protein